MALTRSTDPLVWIDCEMTGLDPSTDTIMSISCILTTSDLLPLDTGGFDAVIQHTPSRLANMSEWCVRTHGASGLTQACINSTTTASAAAQALLQYIQQYIPEPRRALLAGNSIHADKMFLMLPPWKPILDHLHYRLFDVSALKEMIRRWACPAILENVPVKQLMHTAREDILESLTEARYYKQLIESMFPPPGTATTGSPVLDSRQSIPGHANAQTGSHGMVDFHSDDHVPNPKPGPGPPLVVPGNAIGLKQAQEEWNLRRNNGTRAGDVGDLGEGFRTDVP
ncbi:Phosphatidylinositol 3,4,5-trisphosphate-dependent Rac exchanger 2 protein [Exophiala xenobiotica]|uniref:Phosphatidylinositol 3,4,5-trisphosphate-dependent Rac exchanger 2 protein n=1 Tax=Vermiconidia calcicola TaxID=1690605 RepID=A0AAV9Q0W1_9PEZI|nr:Phosphatidylinositol 3,4,5-trisphosphate-dependent Rac exchanger 2 protein [Exophiala xenobiotica]KAK5532001.1 Phosphatidylinositol 3,4,5-trisphosphate-dependent Rac exchanger 2 protein [Vermiconidia calcicola]KAK5539475.1 Phosphatidylinositol 3,4,5-trisphosphate-dependent Rac exchanger 2 protein [Chaetothyriales sp. CCFEE 6169]KAK5208897.1 Phosphatidylinositol 3,4,5-trisphosphate-dependent Rac exchanger 2 protein [Exophiala xenobiotica]KAK5221176.1 Phosphatidylinositol 3,4,5-trisphosphate-d